MPKKIKAEVMYTTQEVAKIAGVSPRTIQLWADSGILTVRKTPGGHRRIPASVLETFLSEMSEVDSTQPDEVRPLRILIAEDEPDLLKLYELSISGWGLPLEIITARDGYEALILLGKEQPDMLIIDLQMPKIDGFHMLEMVNETGIVEKENIVVVTALSKEDIADRGGVQSGITVLTKPIPFTKLEIIVRNKLNQIQKKDI